MSLIKWLSYHGAALRAGGSVAREQEDVHDGLGITHTVVVAEGLDEAGPTVVG